MWQGMFGMFRSQVVTMRCLVLAPVLGSLFAIGSAGCAGASLGDASVDDGDDDEGEPAGEPPVEGDLRQRLAAPTSFVVADQLGGSSASLMAVALSDGQTAAVELAVVGGLVTLSLDSQDRVVFHELLVDTDDVMVSPVVVPPDGLMLTDLTVELVEPARVQLGSWSDDEVAAGAELAVDVKWAVEVDHGVVDLAPIRLSELAFDVSVESDESGRLAAHLSASAPGVFWSWAGIFELHDLEIELFAAVEP
jgi:hypothetical protein